MACFESMACFDCYHNQWPALIVIKINKSGASEAFCNVGLLALDDSLFHAVIKKCQMKLN
jgi:hypothetical protein